MVIARNLTKSVEDNKQLLSHISFQAEPGELIAVLGKSGSGKTTLLRCLSLQEKWDEGQYIVDNQDITNPSLWERWKWSKHFAFLPEKPDLYPQKTAISNVLSARKQRMPLWRLLTGKMSVDEHILGMDYLEKVGLLDKADLRAGQLSGGEQRRVALAKALIKGAKMIVIDEPVAGLDPESAKSVMNDIRAVCHNEQVIVICTLYQVDLAEQYATRIWGLANGKLILDIAGRRLTQGEKHLIFEQ